MEETTNTDAVVEGEAVVETPATDAPATEEATTEEATPEAAAE